MVYVAIQCVFSVIQLFLVVAAITVNYTALIHPLPSIFFKHLLENSFVIRQ